MLTATTRVHQAGPMHQWSGFRFVHGNLPPAAKHFLKEPLAMNGMEISLNSMLPGQGMPFVHRHRHNEETYLFLSGSGQFQADGEVFAIEPGTCVCCAPEVGRGDPRPGRSELRRSDLPGRPDPRAGGGWRPWPGARADPRRDRHSDRSPAGYGHPRTQPSTVG